MDDFSKSFLDAMTAGREQARQSGESARLMSDPGVQPEKGKVYTVSPDFVCGDRSWSDDFIEVIGLNGGTALCKIHSTGWSEDKTRLLNISERFWYPADEMFQAWLVEKGE